MSRITSQSSLSKKILIIAYGQTMMYIINVFIIVFHGWPHVLEIKTKIICQNTLYKTTLLSTKINNITIFYVKKKNNL